MISQGALAERHHMLTLNLRKAEEAWTQVAGLPETEENMVLQIRTMAALNTWKGRLLECELWQQWEERWPRIERAEDLPTERNTLRHDSIPEGTTEAQGWRERERTHRGNADQLSAALPDLPPERSTNARGDVRRAQLRAG